MATKKVYKKIQNKRGDNGIVEFGTAHKTRWVPKDSRQAKENQHFGKKDVNQALRQEGAYKKKVQRGEIARPASPKPKKPTAKVTSKRGPGGATAS